MRCAIYARYSSDMQRQESIEDQIRNCRRFAESRGWTVLEDHIYTDEAVSGASVEGRTQLQRMIDTALTEPKPFDYILVDDTSRLSRDVVDQVSNYRLLRFHGVNIYYVSQGIDTTSEVAEELLITHGLMDGFYIKELGKKTHRGMEGQVLRGYSPGGRVFGYRYTDVPDPAGGRDKSGHPKRLGVKIEIDEGETRTVLRIFRMFTQGTGLKEIARSLNNEGVHSPRDGTGSWCPSSVRAILHNPKYAGDWTWNKTKWEKYPGCQKRKRKERPKEEWVLAVRPELRIIPDELWKKAKDRRKWLAEKYPRNGRGQLQGRDRDALYSKRLFSGFLKCSECGGNIIIINRDTYGCSYNWNRGETVCRNRLRVREEILEDRLLAAIKRAILTPQAVAYTVAKVNEELRKSLTGNHQNLEGVKAEIRNLDREIGNLARFVMEGDTSKTVRQKLEEKERAKEVLEAQLDRLQRYQQDTPITVHPSLIRLKLEDLKAILKTDITDEKIEDEEDKVKKNEMRKEKAARMRVARQALRELLADKIVLRPCVEGEKRFYTASGFGALDSLLGETGLAIAVGAGPRYQNERTYVTNGSVSPIHFAWPVGRDHGGAGSYGQYPPTLFGGYQARTCVTAQARFTFRIPWWGVGTLRACGTKSMGEVRTTEHRDP